MTSATFVPRTEARPSSPLTIRSLTLALVWLAVASGAIVFSEPAPVDALTMMLIVALPIVGLVSIRPLLLGLFAAALVAAATAFFATLISYDSHTSTTHSVISLYLYAAAFVFGAFVAQDPLNRIRFILGAYICAAFVAATAGMAGYFHLVPGAEDLFTKYGRAAGTFKDPNVYGAFLVPAVVYALHLVVTRPLLRTLVPGCALLMLAFAVLLSFSRGAWVNLAIGVAAYGYLSFVTSDTNLHRLRLVLVAALGAIALLGLVAVVLHSPELGEQLTSRASLTQSYDVGPEGRFGGQWKAATLAVTHPFGIGALQFTARYHDEDVHNVYLNMFLNAGWVGGFVYLSLILMTVVLGFSHLLRRCPTQSMFIVVYAAFLGVIVEGLIVDTDHWRHVYLILALLWGVMAVPAPRAAEAEVSPGGSSATPDTDTADAPAAASALRLPERRSCRIVGTARQRMPVIEPAPRRLQAERPRRPCRTVYR